MPDVPAAPAPTADVGADLSAAWDTSSGAAPESSSPSPAATNDSAPPSAGKSPSAPASPSATAGAGADPRPRDASGKFITKDGAPVAPGAQDPAAAAAAPPEFKVPEKWPADVRAKLEAIHKVNPEHAQFLLEQYNHFRQVDRTREGQVSAKLKPLDDLLAKGREQRALQGVDDITYVRNLIAAGDLLDREPEKGLRYLAQRYGIDFQKLANPQAAGQQPETPPEIREIRTELQQTKQFIAEQRQAAEKQQLDAAANWLTSFATQKDEGGQPKYPFFDECIDEIFLVVSHQKERGGQVDLHAAYQRAVQMNDSTRLKDQAARSEAARKAEEARHRQVVEEAKRAGFNASGSGGASIETPANSIRGEIERLYDKQ